MGTKDKEAVVDLYHLVQSQLEIPQAAPQNFCLNRDAYKKGKAGCILEIHRNPPGTGSDSRSSPAGAFFRHLLASVLGAEQVGGLGVSNRPQGPQEVHQGGSVQDGVAPNNPEGYLTGRLASVSGPQGCVFPRASCPILSEVSSFRSGTTPLPVCMPVLWANHISQSVHQDPSGPGGTPAVAENANTSLFG